MRERGRDSTRPCSERGGGARPCSERGGEHARVQRGGDSTPVFREEGGGEHARVQRGGRAHPCSERLVHYYLRFLQDFW